MHRSGMQGSLCSRCQGRHSSETTQHWAGGCTLTARTSMAWLSLMWASQSSDSSASRLTEASGTRVGSSSLPTLTLTSRRLDLKKTVSARAMAPSGTSSASTDAVTKCGSTKSTNSASRRARAVVWVTKQHWRMLSTSGDLLTTSFECRTSQYLSVDSDAETSHGRMSPSSLTPPRLMSTAALPCRRLGSSLGLKKSATPAPLLSFSRLAAALPFTPSELRAKSSSTTTLASRSVPASFASTHLLLVWSLLPAMSALACLPWHVWRSWQLVCPQLHHSSEERCCNQGHCTFASLPPPIPATSCA
mmetsp:Transcript_2415/g.8614  ORF Transcript_2415/g.8614 Transcript_2415/m.8614 type:complete len:304 (+) Transcript_2415:663-1574(+)